MPSRWICLLIIIFWLLANGWLLWHDLLPTLQPGQPPPITIDLLDEVSNQYAEAEWSVSANGREAYSAFTRSERDKDNPDLYMLRFRLRPAALPTGAPPNEGGGIFKANVMTSYCWVTHDGQFRRLEARVNITPGGSGEVDASFDGHVQEGLFYSHYRVRAPFFGTMEGNLDPIPIGHNSAVMVPIHPLQRLLDLRPGQTWQVPTLDLLPGLEGGMRLRQVQARVLPEFQSVRWKDHDAPCYVIEYRSGGDEETRTWVERDSGLVLQQETTLWGERWVLQRLK